ncbi:hypothetical protein BDP27DRAFT_301490 [Rhodocollybia butyracea]|uniref:Uncharacterized protein n=1 Tax=Rhodocollybia butyracea TaxID=206335 RepID=A0A9P5UAV2_9AGAR|nr:hypothetical protein BDP27DRAFT_301490 [Rhodocollybia butyracea]
MPKFGSMYSPSEAAVGRIRVFTGGYRGYRNRSGTRCTQGPADTGIGKLFGALAMLQAIGQMILGPLLFGLIYGNTVAYFPKAIFVVAGGILTAALTCTILVRSPVEKHLVSRKNKSKKRVEDALERGRSRASKDLFGATSSPNGSSSSTTPTSV